MQDSSKAQQALLDRYKQELELLALRWGTDAKEKADRTLTAALGAAKHAMQEILEENAHAVAQTVATQIDNGLARLIKHVRESNKIAMLNAVAAAATFAAAAIWVLVR